MQRIMEYFRTHVRTSDRLLWVAIAATCVLAWVAIATCVLAIVVEIVAC